MSREATSPHPLPVFQLAANAFTVESVDAGLPCHFALIARPEGSGVR